MSDDVASYEFLPWVRRGYQPTETEGLADPIPDPGSLDVEVTPSGDGTPVGEAISMELDVYGPGDVVGLDDRQVVRMEPEPDTGDFSPNYFTMVEFDRPDLPWLFSPVSADDQGRLRPWCCLVVVEQADGVSLSADGSGPLPTLTVGGDADPATELPDPVDAWAWAHAQVVGPGDTAADDLAENSTRTVSRLVASRRLDPGTSYYACVVPTFEPGRLAGLGREPYPDGDGDDGDDPARDVAMAWDPDDVSTPLRLPVYHHWEFSTGREGDFESLVRELEPETLTGLGYRDVDASEPGVEALSTRRRPTDVRLEGALKSAELDSLGYPEEQRTALTELANADDPDGDGRPTFGPPVYGGYHADVGELPPESPTGNPDWLRELNADPRHRVAAGFGVEVVREEQEQLMSSAWDQVGEVRAANRLLRRARLAREASGTVHDDLADLDPATLLTATAGVHDRARWAEAGTTFRQAVAESRVPNAAVSPALRRLLRPDGPIAGRLDADVPDQSTLVEQFNEGYVEVERNWFPDGAGLYTPDGAQPLCTVLADRPAPVPRSPPPLHAIVGLEEAELRDEAWAACEGGKAAVELLAGEVTEEPAGPVTDGLAESAETLCVERGGEFDEGTNLLAGVDAGIEEGDPELLLPLLGAAARALDATCGSADHLDGLTGSLPEEQAEIVAEHVGDVHLACRTLRSTLAARALQQLSLLCEYVSELVADVLPETGEEPAAGVRIACEAVCGPPGGGYGLADRLAAEVSGGDHGEATAVMREIRRMTGFAADRLAGSEVAAELGPVCRDVESVLGLVADGMGATTTDPVVDRLDPLLCNPPPGEEPDEPPALDLEAAREALLDAIDPEKAVPRRVADRLGGVPPGREDPLDRILAAPSFDRPMYESLADLSQEYLLPGVGDVPTDSVGVLETNPTFVRSYMVGLNHEMARELRWREYPTDMRGTYFDRFWGAEGAIPKPDDPADVEPIHGWDVDGAETVHLHDALRRDQEQDGGGGNVVMLVRGELFRRYPNTTVYAVKATYEDTDGDPETPDERVPDMPTGTEDEAPDPENDQDSVRFPMFRGRLESDVTFFGFDLGVDEARGTPEGPDDPGWFLVIEEAPGEPRFGLDVDRGDVGTVPAGIETDDRAATSPGEGEESGWAALSWGHTVGGDGEVDSLSEQSYLHSGASRPAAEGWATPEPDDADWGTNSAHMAAITWQKPVRIAIHADDMLPADEDGGGDS